MVCHGGNTEEQRTFFGALDAGSSNGLDDVLSVAFSVGQYEFIEGVTSGKALGSWLVEYGKAGWIFPRRCGLTWTTPGAARDTTPAMVARTRPAAMRGAGRKYKHRK